MLNNFEQIAAEIKNATEAMPRAHLVARGQVEALKRQYEGSQRYEGLQKDEGSQKDVPHVTPGLNYELKSYGYMLIGLGLRFLDLRGDIEQARVAFEKAAVAMESAAAGGNSMDRDRSFRVLIGAASYHLASCSPQGNSLLNVVMGDGNYSLVERALIQLMRRRILDFRRSVLDYRTSEEGSDARIATYMEGVFSEEGEPDDISDEIQEKTLLKAVDIALTDTFFGAMSLFLMALERGDKEFLEEGVEKLHKSVVVCQKAKMLDQWWVHRIAFHLLEGLWSSTFHERLAPPGKGEKADNWAMLRKLYIAMLQHRQTSVIDLWPSQIEAATCSIDQSKDLLVSLNSHVGRMQVAELCILRCLASDRRVVFVELHRSHLAQTETTLRRTFGPLGKSVGALYGSVYTGSFNEDLIRKRDVVVVTLEDLDYALRNDLSLLNSVGLLVIGEEHMNDLNEHDVGYEIQVNRLLRISNAGQLRIVYLSDVSPSKDKFDDFSMWLRSDLSDILVESDWRPTRLSVGTVEWKLQTAELKLHVDKKSAKIADVQNFIVGTAPSNRKVPKRYRKRIFPGDQRELCLATAWRLSDTGQTVLIYCPELRSVELFAESIVDLNERGALNSLLKVDSKILTSAVAIGKEWLEPNSDILKCLELGVAIHHDALPPAYCREVERLVHSGFLKVFVSAASLTQSIGLSVGAVVMFSLHRQFTPIKLSEFRKVLGWAGQAYRDVDGIVLFPMFNKTTEKDEVWWKYIISAKAIEVRRFPGFFFESKSDSNDKITQFVQYTIGGAGKSIETTVEGADDQKYEADLDIMILSFINANEPSDMENGSALNESIQSSHWYRHVQHTNQRAQEAINATVLGRLTQIQDRMTVQQRRICFSASHRVKD